MGTKEVLSVLILVAGILLSDRCVNGQPAPPSSMAAGQGMCATVPGVEELKVLLSNGDWPDVCSYSTLQYACAGVGNVSSEKISSILECSLKSEDNVKQIEFAVLFSYLSLDILETSINRLNNIVDASSIKAEVKGNLLNAVWEKLQENVEQFSPGFLATWFQNILYFAISAFDPRILDDMTRLNITCNGLEAVVGALDVARAMYDNDTRKEIGKGITRFVQAHSCKKGSPSETMKSFYKGFMRDLEYKDLVVAWGDQDLSKSLPMLTELQMAEYIDTNKAFSNVEEASPVLVQLDTKDLSFITSVLKHLTTDDSTYNMEVMFSLLNITLGKFNSADDSYCRPTFKTIFQGNVAILAINDIILEQLIIRDCSEYQDTYLTVDRVYDKLSDEVKESVCKNRLKYLNEEASKTGSGCTYGLTSVEWFEKIIGRSKDLVSYSDMMRLNSNFEGYGVILSLNNKQTSDMIVQSNLLTDQFPKDMEIRLAPVITYIKNKDFTSLQDTLKELSLRLSQAGIKYIANVQVRNVLLRTIWGIAEKQFSLFTANDWNMWFSDYMTLLFPSITSGQLAALSNSVVKNCSNFQIIVGGLDIAFNNMSQDTRTEVVNWIISYLLKETDSCKGDDMLNVNFRQFKNMTDIDVFLKIYPGLNPLDVLHELSSRQLGQVAATNVELRTNVIIVQEVFSVLTIGSDEEDLVNVGTFWDSFNEADNEITVEVQYKMLQLTTDVISSHLTEMSSEDITLWYEGRLTSVIDVIDKDILAKFPLTVGCDSYKAFAHALSVSYTDTLEASKEDVLDFMVNFLANGTNCEATHTSSVSYIESSFGSYSSMATYEEITSYYAGFNAFESGVLQILTVTQIGDMIVESNIYESLEKSTELFDYLKTISVKHVDACMTQFTETSIKKKIEITNVEVGQYFLKSYLEMKKQDQPYTHEELKHLFEFRIYKLMQFFTSGTLLMLGIKDCDALVNVVAYLDSGYDYMSEEIKSEISAWIIGLLKSLNFNGCRSISQSSSVWKEIIFKRFFQYTTMKEVLEVYPSFDVLAVINDTSSTQKGEYLVTSDALQDVEKTKTVLESLPGADGVVSVNEIYKFLDAVNNNYNEQLVQTMSPAVREECMTILFSHLLENLDALTEVQISNIQEKFKYFLPGVTYTVLQKIPLSMDCNSYSIIFGAISSVFDKLSTAIAQALCNRNLDFLNATSDGSSAVCSSSYTDSKSYMEKIFLNCSSSATLNEMKRYYPKFDAFDVLEKLTAAQMGNLFMNSMAYRDTTAAVLVMAELGKRGYKEMTSFMTECTKVAKEKNLGRLPDPSIRSLMFNTVWKPISVNLRTAEDYMWLRDNCYLVIASITTTDIQSLDVNIDCESQSYMVQAFSNVFGQLGDEQNQAVYDKIKDYNKAKAASGSACDAGNSAEWIKTYYGSYKGYPTLTELKDANSNFNATEALDELSGVQTADYIVENGMLWDAITIAVMINVRKDPGDLEQFLNRLNTVAPTELQNSPAAGVILATTFEKLSGNFMYFKREDWKQWMQETLANILYTVNVTQLDLIPIPLPCDSYQEVVKGLDKAFPLMKKETRKDVYTQCMKRQLDSTVSPNGVPCGEKTDRPQDIIDAILGKFAQFADIADLVKWILDLQIVSTSEKCFKHIIQSIHLTLLSLYH
ncbi:uncharacterized protein LOC142097442 [Mixophyes fleayi]|uniref:uncharacterized protein LOC142097442 n=1 Tax=Mixophyes fleayi TaxID=3061075 RepID=UPI003F4D9821